MSSQTPANLGKLVPHRPAPLASDVHNAPNNSVRMNGAVKKTTSAPAAAATKAKKAVDPAETTKLLAAKISQLENDEAGEKVEEEEIERSVKKASRELREDIERSAGTDPVAQFNQIQKRYEALLADQKRLARDLSKNKKRADQLQKEKDTSRSELSKANSKNHKLENICRELQKDNKLVKSDNKRLREQEQHDRKLLSESLEGMMGTIEDVVAQREQADAGPHDLESDEVLRSRFKSFCEQYELREMSFANSMRSRDYDLQYQTLQCSQAQSASKDRTAQADQLRNQVENFSNTETELRSQLNIYVGKFKQVEDTLNNSNELFLTFRKEMEEMSKKTKRLEKENVALTRIKETGNRNIIEMAEAGQKRDAENDALRKKNAKLEELCRALQARNGQTANSVSSQSPDPNSTVNKVVARAEAELKAAEQAAQAAQEAQEADDEETESEYAFEEGEEEYEDGIEDDAEAEADSPKPVAAAPVKGLPEKSPKRSRQAPPVESTGKNHVLGKENTKPKRSAVTNGVRA